MLHFAAYAHVGESVADPAKYYRNNVGDSLALLEALKMEGERRGVATAAGVFQHLRQPWHPDSDQIPMQKAARSGD